VHLHIHQLGISGGVAEGLHHQIGGEAQAGQILQLVPGHGAGGVLGPHGGHLGFAVGSRADALAFRQATGPADNLLGQGETLAGILGRLGQAEQGGNGQAQGFPSLGGQAPANDQGNPTAGPDFVQDHRGLQLAFRNHRAVFHGLHRGGGVIQLQFDFVAHFHLVDVDFDGQGTRVFLGVKENGGNLAAQAHTAEALVGYEGNVFPSPPQHGVGSGLAGGTGPHHVAHIGHQIALLLQAFQQLHGAPHPGFVRRDAGPGIFQHGHGVQGNIGTGPGIRRRGQVIRIGFAGDFENGQLQGAGHFRAGGEPFTIGPRLKHRLGIGVARLREFHHIVEGVEHQQGLFQAFSGHGAHFGIAQEIDQRFDVVTAQHGAQKFRGLGPRNQGTGELATGHLGQEFGLDLGRIIHPGRNPVGNEINQKSLFPLGRILQQGHQILDLGGSQGQGRNTECSTLGDVLAVGFKHGGFLSTSG